MTRADRPSDLREFDRLSAVQFRPNHCARGTCFKIYGRISMPLDFGKSAVPLM